MDTWAACICSRRHTHTIKYPGGSPQEPGGNVKAGGVRLIVGQMEVSKGHTVSDIAPLLLGTLLVGVVWSMGGFGGRDFLLAARPRAGLGLVAVVVEGGGSDVGRLGPEG